MREVLIVLSSIAVLVALAAFVVFAAQHAQPEAAPTTTGTTTSMATNTAGLPPFANPDFDVLLRPPIVTIPDSGGSASVLITLKATQLNTNELLVLEPHSTIPGYAAKTRKEEGDVNDVNPDPAIYGPLVHCSAYHPPV